MFQYTFLNIKGNNVFVTDAVSPASDDDDEEPDTQFIRHAPRE